MPDETPYEAPTATSPQPPEMSAPNPPSSTDDDRRIAQYAQLGLRLLGVMFIVDGVAGLVGSLVNGMQSSARQQADYSPLPGWDVLDVGWFASSVAYVVVGLYCVIGGGWVLETIFLPSSRTSHTDDDDANSSDE